MMNFKSLLHFVVMLLVVLCAVRCTTEVDYSMGEELVPTRQNMELRRRVYEKGFYRDSFADKVACSLIETRLFQTDSIRSANIKYGYFGCENSEIYGKRKAGFMSQMIFSLSLPEGRGWGYRPIYDSTLLSLYITDYHGDTLPRRYEVYEITSNDYFNLPTNKDTAFYLNFDPTDYISERPIFEFTFPNQERGVYVGDMSNPQSSNVRLESTDATLEYVSRLMLLTDEDGNRISNDELALDKDSLYVEGNEAKFVEQVRGIYIVPKEGTEGAMFATELENTAMLLYTRSRYEEDPTIIRDTTYMVYNLFLGKENYDGDAGNVSVNSVQHDFAGSAVDNFEEMTTTCYVDGMGGVVTEVEFTDEFIQSLADIVTGAGDAAAVSVNNATMSVYLEGSDYDYIKVQDNFGFITPILDASMPRMGFYTDYKKLIGVTDYAYTVETSSVPLNYDGYLNRSLACYKMNISLYVQSLMNVAAKYIDKDGKVDFAKFEAEREDYMSLRRFYIAPAAYSLYGFNRQAIYGMDGEGVAAPIKLELTYTIVK